MSCLLYADDEEAKAQVNIDDLYERKHRRDLKQISIFSKILNRIHKRINIAGRSRKNEKFVWFTVPEYIFGEPNYDQGDCLGYLVSKLEENGFFVKYLHPNTLFISWENYVPTYARTEFKKKTGITVDEHGNIVDRGEDADALDKVNNDPRVRLQQQKEQKEKKEYTSVKTYKPAGVYNPELLERVEKRVHFSDGK
jgi:hypothetical protein